MQRHRTEHKVKKAYAAFQHHDRETCIIEKSSDTINLDNQNNGHHILIILHNDHPNNTRCAILGMPPARPKGPPPVPRAKTGPKRESAAALKVKAGAPVGKPWVVHRGSVVMLLVMVEDGYLLMVNETNG